MNQMTHRPSLEAPQLRTLLLTDLCDSTTLVERIGDVAAATLFRDHDRLVLDLQQRWRGRLIDRSDGMLLLFERPIDGLGFALDYVRGLREMGSSSKLELKARAGLHVGEVLTWRNSEEAVRVGAKPLEVEGLAKPMAARLMAMARPGQILLSAVAEPLAHRAARELGERGQHLLWKSHGRWRFKGVPDSQQIYEVGEPGIAPLRAPPNTPKAWRDIPLWRRPAALAAEAAVIAGIGVGVWFATRPAPAIAFNQRDWVVVADLRNLTGQSVLDDSLEQAFRISLEQSRYVNVLSDLKTRGTLSRMRRDPDSVIDRSIASEIAIRDGARAVILPTVSEVGGKIRISAEVVDPHTQSTVYAESAEGSGAQSLLVSIDDVTMSLRGKLGEALASIDRDSAPLPDVTTDNLDALRAYALGQKMFGQGKYEEAKGFYESAVKMDASFALAHIGLLRTHNALDDLAGGVAHLRKAASLREHLPPRDAMYLDAWQAQVDQPSEALDRWRRLLALYPDFFPAAANVGYAMFARNRFAEGLPYAKRAAAAQYEFAPLAKDLVGQYQLAMGNYDEARSAFGNAVSEGVGGASVRAASTDAAQLRFDGVQKLLVGSRSGDDFEYATFYMDTGQWTKARAEAETIAREAGAQSSFGRSAALPVAVAAWMQGHEKEALTRLRDIGQQAIDAAVAPSASHGTALDDAYLGISAGILAQRLGEGRLAADIIRRLEPNKALLESPSISDLLDVLKANQARMAGDNEDAIASLERMVRGNARFQARVALMDAYIAAGKPEAALEQARWIADHRGLAYIEFGCSWCQQPLNVVDTTLTRLRAAELLAQLGKREEVDRQLAAFDRQWPRDTLPGYLRVRRDALALASN